jgi:hypothetical protein
LRCACSHRSLAETLPLPGNLTDLNANQGETFFLQSGARANCFPIVDNCVTQKTQAYCGVASMVMVLNAAGVPAPTTPEYQPYHIFTQDNVLDDRTEAVLPALRPRQTSARRMTGLYGAKWPLMGSAVDNREPWPVSHLGLVGGRAGSLSRLGYFGRSQAEGADGYQIFAPRLFGLFLGRVTKAEISAREEKPAR